MKNNEKKFICVLCGRDWKPYMNVCECGGFCTWGYEIGKPLSWTIEDDGKWKSNTPTDDKMD